MPRPTTRWWRILALLLAAMTVMAACGDDDDDAAGGGGQEKQTIAFAFVGPKTGSAANLGLNIRDGILVALEELNAESDEYNFVLKEFDTQGDPAQAPGQAQKYIPDQEIVAVIGPTFSGETKAVIPLLQQANLVMVSPSATNVELPTVSTATTSVFHRVVPDDEVQSQGITDYLAAEYEPEKVAYIHDNTEYGKGLWTGVVDKLTATGARNVVADAIDPRATDYSVVVNKVRAADPEVIFYGGYYAEAGRLKKQLTDAGVTSLYITGDGSLDEGFIKESGVGGEGAVITCACRLARDTQGGGLGDFAKRYEDQIGKLPGTYSTEGYDTMKLLAQGVEEGNTTREALLRWVEELDSYEALSKTIEFEANGNVKAGLVYVYEVKGGKLTELGTADELAA